MPNETDQFEILKTNMNKFLEERDWTKFHTPKNIAMSIAIEAAELMEIFQWSNPSKKEIINDELILSRIKDELADVLIYSISMGLQLDIDIFACIKDKMNKNHIRFPINNLKNPQK